MMTLKLCMLLGIIGLLVDNSSAYDATYRLSNNHIPKSYDLEMAVSPYFNSYNGTVTIHFSTKKSTNNIRLHAAISYLTLTQIKVNNENLCDTSHPYTALEYKTEIVDITCKNIIAASNENKITILYTGLFHPMLKNYYYWDMGLKKSNYRLPYYDKSQSFAATQFEPMFARRAFPCFDEPQFKAEFNVTITHLKNWKAIFNTPAYSQNVENGLVYSKFEKTPPMSTYLLAFVVSKFQTPIQITMDKTSSLKSLEVDLITYQQNFTETVRTYGGVLVEALENWLGISYTDLGMKTLSFVILPYQYKGAVPSWGLISFHEFSVLDNGTDTSPELKQFIVSNMAYELALQWFGDYITPDWWSNVWMKEAFAGYFTYFIPDQVQTIQMDRQRQFITEYIQPALYSDSPYPFGDPLSSKEEDVYWQDHIAAKMWNVNYQKGACIIRMIEGIIGENDFKKGVHQYLKENKYKNTNPTILLNTLDRFYNNSSHPLIKTMHNWIYNPGYPLVTVLLNKDGKSVTIHQDEYNSNGKNKTIWYIPLTYTTSNDRKFDIKVEKYLHDKPLKIELKQNAWIIVNLQQSGFYRVNYDKELWKRIIDVLKSKDMKQIHVSNRAQLIDDVFTLASKGIISYNISLNLLEYIKKETEFEPWYTADTWIKETIFRLRSLGNKQNLQKFQQTALGWIKAAFPHGVNATTHLQKLTKNVILELKRILEKPSKVEQSQNILENSSDEKRNNDESKNNLEILLEKYKNSTRAFERKEILSEIGYVENPIFLERFLWETILENNQFSEKDVRAVYETIYKNANFGLEVYFKFLKENLKEILNRFRFMSVPELLVKAADRILNEKQLSQLKEIIEKYGNLEKMKQIGETLLEEKKMQLEMQKEQIQDIVSSLSLHNYAL